MRALSIAILTSLVCACAPRPAPTEEVEPEASAAAPIASPADTCPSRLRAPELLAGVTPDELTLSYWLAALASQTSLDDELLSPAQVDSANAAMAADVDHGLAGYDVSVPPTAEEVAAELGDRLEFMRAQIESGSYVLASGEPVPPELQGLLQPSAVHGDGELRVVLDTTQVHCAPFTDGLFTRSLDLRIDRNHCSSLRSQEPVRVFPVAGDIWLAKARYTTGWIRADAHLSPIVTDPRMVAALVGPRGTLAEDASLAGVALTPGASVPLDSGEALAFDDAGGRWAPVPAAVRSNARPMTRRAVLEAAFAEVGRAYGWGGGGGGVDCSRFLMDLFSQFGLELPRFSAVQAHAGSFSIDVSSATESDKLRVLDAANRRGVVLLHFPGHIMLYLGRDAGGEPKALHSFAEYVSPCAEPEPGGDSETLFEVDRVTVSNLELGRGSSRRSFIERLTLVTVLGGTPGPELDGAAVWRDAAPMQGGEGATCAGDENAFLIVSPRAPNAEQPLRVIVTAEEDPGPVEIAFTGPDGVRQVPPMTRLPGPPYGFIAEIEAPAAGRWVVAMGDGPRVLECETVDVARRRPAPRSGSGPVWSNRRAWSAHYENLYATWVQALFGYPVEEDLTWTSLDQLTSNAAHNFLYDYYGEREDERLRLGPDCADLPYMLRAYFAWKMGLPYGFRGCSRGRAGRPPSCSNLQTNLMDRGPTGDVDAFQRFAARDVANGVHSASGRTAPADDDTDFYPVALTRESLTPGTVYADPYGHMLIIAGWVPQGIGEYGVLMGADAQPDGTVGRRRFWRGSFLFTPETTDVGAGFKAYRPLVVRGGAPESLTNAELARSSEFAPFSMQQYEGTQDDFYAAVEAVINPRPLDPHEVLASLVDALDESVSRRVNSVDNGEAYMRARGEPVVDMPDGYSIFETVGAWEDFATPSRDMRLLISIDTVRLFPDRVAAAGAQYGLPAAGPELDATVADLRATLDAELASRGFEYTRTDGSAWRLTLAEVVERALALEVAYNPNDCPEHRWGAPEGSDERSTCRRHAPQSQVAKMERYRAWFAARARPPR
ncbi:MAG: C40 family peptidase [Myxococcales bacterium]|nr:C40 family peptidase [Myxococcales bacterium]